jgi:hypothetical protein
MGLYPSYSQGLKNNRHFIERITLAKGILWRNSSPTEVTSLQHHRLYQVSSPIESRY